MGNVVEQRGLFWWLNEPDGQTNTKETSVSGSLTVTGEGHIASVQARVNITPLQHTSE